MRKHGELVAAKVMMVSTNNYCFEGGQSLATLHGE